MDRLFFICVCTSVATSVKTSVNWKEDAQNDLKEALNRKLNTNVARNVILFIGDGMGISTVTAARIRRGQLQGNTGEDTVLAFERFPYVSLSKTYSNDKQVTDSASTATALMCGQKVNYRTLGLDDRAQMNDCQGQYGKEISCITEWSRDEGKSVGIVTTARLTHATPAAAYAKSASRSWEGDSRMRGVEGGCKDIAHQLVFNNSYIQVLFGGGRRFFLKANSIDPEHGARYMKYQRIDGLDLTKVWLEDKLKRNMSARYVWKTKDFNEIDTRTTDYALGLFEGSHMQYELDRDSGPHGEPSLANMTAKAIQILQKNKNGFFLLVEGGRIDHGHHASKAKRAIHEVLSFEEAVMEAMSLTSEKDTLIVVTADHSHVFNIAGYPKRGNDILGVVDPIQNYYLPSDGIPWTTLVYGNGPGYDWGTRVNVSAVDTTDKDFIQASAVPRGSETHGGEDVAIYSYGPMAHLLHGVREQHYVAHVMAYAACVGENKNHCKEQSKDYSLNMATGQNQLSSFSVFVLAMCLLLVYFLSGPPTCLGATVSFI